MRGMGVSFALLILLAVAFVFVPARLGVIAAIVFALGVGIAIVSIVRTRIQEYRAGRVDRRAAIRSALIEILRLAIGLGLSILLARRAAAYFIDRLSGVVGFVLGMIAALAIGIAINMLVRRVFALSWKRQE